MWSNFLGTFEEDRKNSVKGAQLELRYFDLHVRRKTVVKEIGNMEDVKGVVV